MKFPTTFALRDPGAPPFVWDEARRFQLRCELDAAYILDTFPIVRRKDEAAHGTYRTRDTILALYDQFAEAQPTAMPFTSPLDPPPGNPRACHPKRKIAILAFGSLKNDPGKIGPHIAMRIKTETPFKVEYGRLSGSRGGGPTLVPHEQGGTVEAELLVLPDNMSFNDARDLLWLRERHKEDSGQTYVERSGDDDVVVRVWNKESEWGECPWVENVFYTDFNPGGKKTLTAEQLAKAAIASVNKPRTADDGITYLDDAEKAGITTPLTEDYRKAILRLTHTESLPKAREQAMKSTPISAL